MAEDRQKEAQRAELHRTIWRIANDLRGSIDGWDFKAYVLGMLFYRFISENLTAYLNDQVHAAGDPDFDYAGFSDFEASRGWAETVKEKGFFILPSELHPLQRLVQIRVAIGKRMDVATSCRMTWGQSAVTGRAQQRSARRTVFVPG